LVTDAECFEELQRQPTQEPSFATPELRRNVYPFRNGLDHASNLVTLLCWAERLEVRLAQPNRFLEARLADPAAWARGDTDRRRKSLSLRLPGAPRLKVEHRHAASRFTGLALTALALVVAAVTVAQMITLRGSVDRRVLAVALVLAVAELILSGNMLGF